MQTDFSTRLRILRVQKGLTQAKICKDLMLSKNTISMYEAGKRLPDSEVLLSLADYFEVSVDYLLGRENPKGDKRDKSFKKVYEELKQKVPSSAREELDNFIDLLSAKHRF